jgi:6-pyruvoyltetrahydropterin/6-carboxytetrahydropterin synthase
MSKKIRITKVFDFEMAHALKNHDGACKNIHGHSYKLYVSLRGEVLNDASSPKNGMLMDFSDLKAIVKKEIIEVYDHCLLLNKEQRVPELEKEYRIIYTDYQPTSENIIQEFAEKISKKLPQQMELYSLRLHETERSYVEWFAAD